MGLGRLQVQLYIGREARPVTNATITVKKVSNGTTIAESNFNVDSNGKSPHIKLETKDKDLTLKPTKDLVPYETYDIYVKSTGFKDVIIHGVEIFDGITTLQEIAMLPSTKGKEKAEVIDIPKNALLLDIPNKQVGSRPTSTYVLREPYIPQYITVHLGSPDSYAEDVTIPFIDYIKNVASSEIYPTWPTESLISNINCQVSFALNRIYTEWYRNKGYSFQITNSTAYDQYFVKNRNIYDNISKIVDSLFNVYIGKIGFEEPLFAKYCNGSTVTCNGLSQWGTVDLANKNYSALEILRYYYGNDIELRQTSTIGGTLESYPGEVLKLGKEGADVETIQIQLNRISDNYPAIPKIYPVNGIYDENTEKAVKSFQKIFNLTADGIIGRATWYKISSIYVAIKSLAELESEGEELPSSVTYPGILKKGSTGEAVKQLQYFLSAISAYYEDISSLKIDGIFGTNTENTVKDFQNAFNLEVDGIVGKKTWNKIYNTFKSIEKNLEQGIVKPSEYPGYVLKKGSTGHEVKKIQSYLSSIASKYTVLPNISADGHFGSKTKAAVIAFQKYFGLNPDGIVGPTTWNMIFDVYSKLDSTNKANTPKLYYEYPNIEFKIGDSGNWIKVLQEILNIIHRDNSKITPLILDGEFGEKTRENLVIFQLESNLDTNGIINKNTWDAMMDEYINAYFGKYVNEDNRNANNDCFNARPALIGADIEIQHAHSCPSCVQTPVNTAPNTIIYTSNQPTEKSKTYEDATIVCPKCPECPPCPQCPPCPPCPSCPEHHSHHHKEKDIYGKKFKKCKDWKKKKKKKKKKHHHHHCHNCGNCYYC